MNALISPCLALLFGLFLLPALAGRPSGRALHRVDELVEPLITAGGGCERAQWKGRAAPHAFQRSRLPRCRPPAVRRWRSRVLRRRPRSLRSLSWSGWNSNPSSRTQSPRRSWQRCFVRQAATGIRPRTGASSLFHPVSILAPGRRRCSASMSRTVRHAPVSPASTCSSSATRCATAVPHSRAGIRSS